MLITNYCFFFVACIEKNKEARGKMLIPGGHRSKSIVVRLHDNVSCNKLNIYHNIKNITRI